MLNMTFEYRLNLTAKQAQTFDEWLEASRRVWNFALAERKDWYNSRSCRVDACSIKSEYIIPTDAPRPTFASQCKALTEAKKSHPELKTPNAQMLQQVLRRLEKAFVSMWEQKHGFPRFKKSGRMRSMLFPQLSDNPVQGNKAKPPRSSRRRPPGGSAVKLPGVGWCKMRLSRPIPDGFVVKQAQVVKGASGWFVMLTLQADFSQPDVMPHGDALGIDLGLINFLATSNGQLFDRPRFFVDLQRKLKLLQQRVSCKVKGSNNWRKAVQKVSRLHEHIHNTRKNFHFQLANKLCDSAGMIFAEDLNLKAMSKGMLRLHTLDAGFGQFISILEWVCWKRGVYFALVDANGTSQTCPNCLTITGKKDLNQRVHSCPECGYQTDRDVAAAQVVVQRGLAAVGSTVKMLSEGKVVGLPLS